GQACDLAPDVPCPDERAQSHAAEHQRESARQLVGLAANHQEREEQIEQRACECTSQDGQRRAPVCAIAMKPVTAPISITPSRPRFTTPARSPITSAIVA